ncbi:MAG: DUF3987 domain-containing protein [Candidatus Nanopelagicaceae bacterium]
MNTILTAFGGKNQPSLESYFHALSQEGIMQVYSHYNPEGIVKKARGPEVMVQAFCHRDNNPSMSLNTDSNMYYCHACQEGGNILDMLKGFTGKSNALDAYSSHFGIHSRGYHSTPKIIKCERIQSNNTRTTHYYYGNCGGRLRVVRRETYSGNSFSKSSRVNKTFHTEYLENDKWATYRTENDPDLERLSINLETAVYGTTESEILVIAEGESNVDLFQNQGIAACCFHSKYKLKPANGLKQLRTEKVILAIDNDTAGEKFSQVYSEGLKSLGLPFVVLRWKDYGVPEHGDLEEFLVGRTGEDLKEVLDSCISRLPEPETIQKVQETSHDNSDLIASVKNLAVQLSGCPQSEVVEACIKHKLSRDHRELLTKLIAENESRDCISSVLEQSISVPDLLLNEFLPKTRILGLLGTFSKTVQVPESAVLLTFLATIASCCRVGVSLMLRRSSSHKVQPWIYVVLVGQPGSGKTPVINAVTTAPLRLKQQEFDAEYKVDLESYELEMREYDCLPKDQKKDRTIPVKPTRRAAFVSDATTEAVVQLMEQDPTRPVLMNVDEFASLVNTRGKYSKGTNADAQFYNAVFSGQVPITLRKSTGLSGSGSGGVVILGGTQPAILQQMFKQSTPESGEWSRYAFCSVPATRRDFELEDSEGTVDFSHLLKSIYDRVYSYPPKTYGLSKEAFTLWAKKSNDFSRRNTECEQPYLQHVYCKSNEMMGRFALLLHISDAALTGQAVPADTVSLETMARAARLTENFIAESAKVFSEMDTETQLFNVALETLKKQGRISYRDLQNRFNGEKRRLFADKFHIWADLLIKKGIATKHGDKRGYHLELVPEPTTQNSVLDKEDPIIPLLEEPTFPVGQPQEPPLGLSVVEEPQPLETSISSPPICDHSILDFYGKIPPEISKVTIEYSMGCFKLIHFDRVILVTNTIEDMLKHFHDNKSLTVETICGEYKDYFDQFWIKLAYTNICEWFKTRIKY